ncbi:hypothetical protein DFA_00593 [Cavenderia fasciculata]|uniref:Spore coat protein U domain-containing protein n=1 Tax=Cavenderia fasciculata TaxID=261658 RepID=F4PSN8_CACFS|nr:uncharacterized protein DFA_00593 [Cavenderia fasciculata]EGG20730.1 hypothetical protein DFA_00593 [Cavenderia fasciculata]|eukprot:XP_004358580.1 hypothetical protein DFA_00593 [Cavenderia fasciculata]
MYKIITVISLLFAIIAISNAASVLSGRWIWQTAAKPCGQLTYTNVTSTGNTFQSYGVGGLSNTFLVNCTVNPADNTFTGLGTLYTPGTFSISGYTNVKGQLLNPFSLVAVYASNSNPYYPGGTQYYVFSNCNSNLEEMESQQDTYFENFKGLDVVGLPFIKR